VDDIIVFRGLTRANLKEIVKLELQQVKERLTALELELIITNSAIEFLIDKGYNPDFGARPLRRAIERYLEDPLSEEVLRGVFKGDRIIVEAEGSEKLSFRPETEASEGAPGDEKAQPVQEGASTSES